MKTQQTTATHFRELFTGRVIATEKAKWRLGPTHFGRVFASTNRIVDK